jgi:molecular chaperone HscB
MDPFDTLGIEPRFQLDLKDAEKRHLELSRALHPDRYVGRPASERRLALSKAIEANEAWRILRDPLRRAQCLLSRAGIDAGETGGTQADPALLMEMMEHREALADVRMSRDAARLEALTGEMQRRETRLLASLGSALDGSATLRDALPVLSELRFVRRFLDEASAIEDELS